MKKIMIISLLLLIALVVKIQVVYAKDYDDSFYPGNFINDEYIKKTKNGESEYKQSRFIFRTSDDRFAYCIAPFDVMKENETYKAYTTDYSVNANLSEEVWTRIRLISYYGYRYNNHSSSKWYTITQMMIWKVIDPNAKFEWTDTLGGNVIKKYEDEMKEINELVDNHLKLPNYANKTYNISIDKDFKLEDKSFDISSFNVTSADAINITKNKNDITINTKKEGKYELKFNYRYIRFMTYPIVYVDPSAQDLMVIGNNADIEFKVNLNVESGSIKLKKLDKDTKEVYSLGATNTIGTVYGLYNSNNELINKLTINEDGISSIKNLPYDNYCLLELESNKGYIKDEEKHCFTVNHNNLNIELELYNEIIKEEITINKYIQDKSGEKVNFEKDISFQISGITHSYEGIITTNKLGYASIILPYGKYLVHQLNTTNNYKKIDDFIVNVDGKNKDYNYELINKKDEKEKETIIKKEIKPFKEEKIYEIKVPNTSSNKKDIKKSIFISTILTYVTSMVIHYYRKIKNNTI